MKVIADGWYAWQLPGAESFEAWLDARPAPLARLARRVGAVRGALLFAASTRRDAVAVIRTDPGWRALLLLRAALGRRRKLVALHFIAHPSGLGDRLDRWATRRALRAAQVLSAFEAAEYARRYGTDRFRHVPFPLLREAAPLPPAPAEPLVVAGGRAYCDWPTLFAAAAGADWPLTVVCSAEDRPEVDRLNADGRATVLTALDHDAFRDVLRRATRLRRGHARGRAQPGPRPPGRRGRGRRPDRRHGHPQPRGLRHRRGDRAPRPAGRRDGAPGRPRPPPRRPCRCASACAPRRTVARARARGRATLRTSQNWANCPILDRV